MPSTPSQPTFTVGDTAPSLRGTCTTDPGSGPVPVDGTSAVSEIHIRPYGTSGATPPPVIVQPVNVGSDGTWAYDWRPGDLAVAGTYQAEVQVTGQAGSVTTFGPCFFAVRAQIA